MADLEDAEYAVFKAEQALENARLDLAEAESALEDAQKDYDEAMSMSPEITAPFDGFVTKVNVTGGDEVLKGTIAVQIADTNKFEAEIYVSEMDIGKINIGSRATITADALTGMVFPAKVTHISPTATIQSGVVNYKVRVELEELPATMPQQMFPATDNTTTAFPPVPRMTGMSGNVTREQGDMFMRNRPSGGFFPFGSGNATLPRGMTMGTTTASQLREGLSVTVSIIVDSRTNVLVVPNGAIITEGFATYVEVIKDTGATEKRAVKTGLSNWQYTEITEGLTEGEKVKVSLTAGTSSSSLRMRSGMFFGPPPGR
ncbi:MAG: HlyD family efflux transporter periplasmic adaptor subunit [Dehalococcoidales bacterium]|nr:HlyD family efflux transporter periplasmic adaptor subunit [Dehalococcoidales bacterium]